ncbi:RNA exonuclease 3, partial [Blyttiomyces sp. JEL0837]
GIVRSGAVLNATSKAVASASSTSSSSSSISRSSTASASHQKKTAQSLGINVAAPPVAPVDLNSKVPRAQRQKVLNLFFEEFRRIYAPILNKHPKIAHEHALRQEFNLHIKASNISYSPLAMPILQRLKKRPVAKSESDVGIDGEWNEKVVEQKIVWKKEILESMKASREQLELHGYPILEIEEMEQISPTVEGKLTCDRCKRDFSLSLFLSPDDKKACNYHDAYARFTKLGGTDNVKERIYPCCGRDLNSDGCQVGPHVFKESDCRLLHKRIPFVKLREGSSKSDSAKKVSGKTEDKLLVACDCEMSYTAGGMELTRVTFLDPDGGVLIDELVKTKFPVVDLNTKWSGVSDLSNAKLDLPGVHEKLNQFMSQNTFIVGHGLENDMNALRLIHPKIIDTALLFPFKDRLETDTRMRKYSLKFLTEKLLERRIQMADSGHDSKEDALAALDLVRLFHDKKIKGENLTV